MHQLLSKIESAADLQKMSVGELTTLAAEIRDVLCNLLSTRTAHFASNLGVVELCLALHNVFDFRRDRLIWDTGHQVYPHKMITGRFHEFGTMRTKGGLMGYPNPNESEYDLLLTGPAGAQTAAPPAATDVSAASTMEAIETVPGFSKLMLLKLSRNLRVCQMLYQMALVMGQHERLALALLNLAKQVPRVCRAAWSKWLNWSPLTWEVCSGRPSLSAMERRTSMPRRKPRTRDR